MLSSVTKPSTTSKIDLARCVNVCSRRMISDNWRNSAFAEQVNVFDQAASVVGAHGAGMTNIGFCRPGTAVLELIPQHHINGCFFQIGVAAGVRYQAAVYASVAGNTSHRLRWKADVPDVVRLAKDLSAG